ELNQGLRIDDLTLHYLEGQVEVEVCLSLDQVQSIAAARALAEGLRSTGEAIDGVARIKVVYH
ncbi:MAG: hypothetical protein GWN58_31485, partial [Anaerolineae bacterium]|nr:hypothetical protein [Anaerolineae bacterium]